jgi:hypothetical protein
MRKVSLFCLFSVLSLLLVVSPSFARFPLYPPPPILDLPLADLQSGAGFGYSLAAGDLNGDGYTDVVVGVPDYGEGDVTHQGRVYVYDGSGGCLIKTIAYPGSARAVTFGQSVAIGDFDGNGVRDIIIGAPRDDGPAGTTAEGKVYVFYGPSFDTYLAIDKPGLPQDDANFGFALAAGSTDADAADELIVGAPYEGIVDHPNRGHAYHFKFNSGSADSIELSPAVNQTDMWYGFSVTMGDLLNHGGGQKDPIIGAPGYNVTEPVTLILRNEAGAVYWWDMTGPVPVETRIDKPALPAPYVPVEAVAHFGWSVAAGDVSAPVGDVELVVGAPDEDLIPLWANIGLVYVVDKAGVMKYALTSPNWNGDGGQFGSSLALGDVDGDTILDIIVGAPTELVGTTFDSGQVYVFHSDPLYDGVPSVLDDLLIDAAASRIVGVGTSTEYLFDGVGNDGPSNFPICEAGENCANVIAFHNHEANAGFGWAVASGNINNAPWDDVIVSGINVNKDAIENVGRVFLFFEDAQPEPPTGLSPVSPPPVESKTVVLSTDGIFIDKDVATCGPDRLWTDLHQRTEWRISYISELDCTTNGPGKLLDIQTGPGLLDGTNLYQTPPIDLGSLTTLLNPPGGPLPDPPGPFNFGDTVYWCVRYKDNVNGGTWTWSNWSSASFTIGVPDLVVDSVVDILGADSPYVDPTGNNISSGNPPPDAPHKSRVNFQTVSCDDCRTVDITIRNIGNATAHITAIDWTGVAAGNGSLAVVSTPTLPFDVAPDGTYVVRVEACGGIPVGDTTRILRTTYDDPIDYYIGMKVASAAPVGDVVPGSPAPFPAVPPYDFDLGPITIGSAPPVCNNVAVTETGGVVPLKVTVVTLTELFVSPLSPLYSWTWTDPADQAYWDANGFLYVPAGGSKSITVCFDPKAGSGCGLREANLEVTHNGNACTDLLERTTFAATVAGPDLEGRWTSFSSSMGSTDIRGTLRLANIGTIDLIDAAVSAPPADHFRVSFYVSSDATLDTADTFLYYQDVFTLLRAGQSKNIGFNYTFGESAAGNYIIAVIDSEQNFYECIDFVGPIPPLPPSAENPAPLPAYFPFPPGNVNINNITVPAKLAIGAFAIR